jgi:hypothetical protein
MGGAAPVCSVISISSRGRGLCRPAYLLQSSFDLHKQDIRFGRSCLVDREHGETWWQVGRPAALVHGLRSLGAVSRTLASRLPALSDAAGPFIVTPQA